MPYGLPVKHASDATLDMLEPLLERVRALAGLREKKRGVFYRGAVACLHFHEDKAGLFADVKGAGGWERLCVSAEADCHDVLGRLGEYCG